MNNPRGKVVSVMPGAQRVVVDVASAPVCPRCASGKGCGAGLFVADAGGPIEVGVIDGLRIQAGDKVEISLAPVDLLHAALVVYGWPLAGALLFAGVAALVGSSEILAIWAALGGLAVGLLAGRLRLRREPCLTRFVPIVDKRIDADA